MNIKKIQWWIGGVGVDSSYQSILDRATSLGYTLPSVSQQAKQNTLVTNLKSSGVWDLLDLLYVFATDGDANFATINWKSPSSFQITQVNTPTFTSNQGFNGNGSSQYLNTNWIPSTNGVNFTLNSSCGFFHTFSHITQSGYEFGTAPNFISSPPLFFGRSDDGFGSAIFSINQNSSCVVPNGGNGAGFWQIQRKDASNNYTFKNGSQVDTEADASTAVPTTRPVFVLAYNAGGAPAGWTTRKVSCFGAGASLDGLENDLYTAWNTYLTSL